MSQAIPKTALLTLLVQAVESAKGSKAELVLRHEERSNTENETTVIDVSFSEKSGSPFLDLRRLLSQLEKQVTVGGVDLLGPPQRVVIVHGARNTKNFEIAVHL